MGRRFGLAVVTFDQSDPSGPGPSGEPFLTPAQLLQLLRSSVGGGQPLVGRPAILTQDERPQEMVPATVLTYLDDVDVKLGEAASQVSQLTHGFGLARRMSQSVAVHVVDMTEARPAAHRARLARCARTVMARGQLQVGMGITDFGGGDPSMGKVGEYRTPLQRVVDDIARSHAARLRRGADIAFSTASRNSQVIDEARAQRRSRLPVTVSSTVRRVVSLVPSLTESVAASCPDVLVGATRWCTHPADLDVARVGGTKNRIWPGSSSSGPDLVLANEEENRREPIWRRCVTRASRCG